MNRLLSAAITHKSRPASLLSFVLLFFGVLFADVAQAVDLRVAIKKQVSRLDVGSSTTAVVKDQRGQVLGEIAGLNSFSASGGRGGVKVANWRSSQLTIEPTGNGQIWIGDRWYRGAVQLTSQGIGVTAVNKVDLEDYLFSVVGAEAIPSWPQEALKAQAVAARTYALYKRGQAKNGLYELDNTTSSQVYKGLDSEFDSTRLAVQATSGEIMTYGGQLILAAFHSSSGGHTENVEDVWSKPLPYLRGVVDYDQTAPVFEWSKSISAGQVSRAIGGIGQVRSFVPVQTSPQGRVAKMKVVGTRGSKVLTGAQIRKALDLRSTLFRIQSNGGSFYVFGRGFGHGVGLSQWGAQYLSTQGVSYQQILAHYYQQANISSAR
ncbi:MAG: SpoIID/LytB domain-containing protein [Cyanobacteria bacterium P01_H01_bin.15]